MSRHSDELPLLDYLTRGTRRHCTQGDELGLLCVTDSWICDRSAEILRIYERWTHL